MVSAMPERSVASLIVCVLFVVEVHGRRLSTSSVIKLRTIPSDNEIQARIARIRLDLPFWEKASDVLMVTVQKHVAKAFGKLKEFSVDEDEDAVDEKKWIEFEARRKQHYASLGEVPVPLVQLVATSLWSKALEDTLGKRIWPSLTFPLIEHIIEEKCGLPWKFTDAGKHEQLGALRSVVTKVMTKAIDEQWPIVGALDASSREPRSRYPFHEHDRVKLKYTGDLNLFEFEKIGDRRSAIIKRFAETNTEDEVSFNPDLLRVEFDDTGNKATVDISILRHTGHPAKRMLSYAKLEGRKQAFYILNLLANNSAAYFLKSGLPTYEDAPHDILAAINLCEAARSRLTLISETHHSKFGDLLPILPPDWFMTASAKSMIWNSVRSTWNALLEKQGKSKREPLPKMIPHLDLESIIQGENENDASEEVTLAFKPGKMGLKFSQIDGYVLEVHKGTQAEKKGVKVGMRILNVGGMPFSQENVDAILERRAAYQITLVKDWDYADRQRFQDLVFKFKPGDIGIKYRHGDGLVTEVFRGTQADVAGVRVGMKITKVKDKPFSHAAFLKRKQRRKAYQLTFAPHDRYAFEIVVECAPGLCRDNITHVRIPNAMPAWTLKAPLRHLFQKLQDKFNFPNDTIVLWQDSQQVLQGTDTVVGLGARGYMLHLELVPPESWAEIALSKPSAEDEIRVVFETGVPDARMIGAGREIKISRADRLGSAIAQHLREVQGSPDSHFFWADTRRNISLEDTAEKLGARKTLHVRVEKP